MFLKFHCQRKHHISLKYNEDEVKKVNSYMTDPKVFVCPVESCKKSFKKFNDCKDHLYEVHYLEDIIFTIHII